MIDGTGEIALALCTSTYDYRFRDNRSIRHRTIEWDLVESVTTTVRMMELVIRSRRQLFKKSKRKNNGRSDLEDRFLGCYARLDYTEIQRHFPICKVNPLVWLFEQHAIKLVIRPLGELEAFDIDELNACVRSIRIAAKGKIFKKQLQDHYRSPKKNRLSLAAYVAKICVVYPSLSCLRIHLGYSELDRSGISSDDCKSHRKTFLVLLKKMFPSGLLAGHVWKVDFSLVASFHVHVLLLIDARLEHQMANIVRELERLWVVATGAKGAFFNCDRFAGDYPGVGRICGDPREKRALLQKAVTAMTMSACYMKMSAPNKDRTFGKGVWPKRAVLSSHANVSWTESPRIRNGRMRLRD